MKEDLDRVGWGGGEDGVEVGVVREVGRGGEGRRGGEQGWLGRM